ncbi:hypothetical protein BOTBODRAFT_177961 [Botryobasidium botryosum FD-172 SS1]|uniref:Uncharacterized protein n=1 Tax=Botryobasidium botryosum (strain FD-172 SS1) TaxID=930990 RepID=A0A067M7J0_BOTB1|nr:hypothetical protein BOTBODRAFT_177961 [Botryobasidium botryosum FD-172 SS1]
MADLTYEADTPEPQPNRQVIIPLSSDSAFHHLSGAIHSLSSLQQTTRAEFETSIRVLSTPISAAARPPSHGKFDLYVWCEIF